jgi:hypothetical protein
LDSVEPISGVSANPAHNIQHLLEPKRDVLSQKRIVVRKPITEQPEAFQDIKNVLPFAWGVGKRPIQSTAPEFLLVAVQ